MLGTYVACMMDSVLLPKKMQNNTPTRIQMAVVTFENHVYPKVSRKREGNTMGIILAAFVKTVENRRDECKWWLYCPYESVTCVPMNGRKLRYTKIRQKRLHIRSPRSRSKRLLSGWGITCIRSRACSNGLFFVPHTPDSMPFSGGLPVVSKQDANHSWILLTPF